MRTHSSRLLDQMPVLVKTIAFWTLNVSLAVLAFLVYALAANTFLSHVLPLSHSTRIAFEPAVNLLRSDLQVV